MKMRNCLLLLGALVTTHADVYGLTPPSASDGPIRLLACVVSPQGILEAEVDNQTADTMNCSIRCNYEVSEKMLSYTFNVTIPGNFQGRVGRYDTSVAKAGSYSGDLGTCKSLHGENSPNSRGTAPGAALGGPLYRHNETILHRALTARRALT